MRRHLWWVLGLVLVVAGVVVTLSARSAPDDFGWFAAAPPAGGADWYMGWSETGTSGSLILMTRWQLAGCALAVIGLLVLAAGLGFRMGRRRAEVGP